MRVARIGRGRYFLTIEPDVPYRVTETVRPCSRMLESVVGGFSHTSCLRVWAEVSGGVGGRDGHGHLVSIWS